MIKFSCSLESKERMDRSREKSGSLLTIPGADNYYPV